MILNADARHIPMPDGSVHCVVTSPPYWGLRDYGLDGRGIGLEPTPELYVVHIVDVFREVRRVLRDDGTLWLNLADCYQGGDRGRYRATRGDNSPKQQSNLGSDTIGAPNRLPQSGLKPKDLCMIPARVALALQADGWWLRSDIIWSKPNPMPESVTDRPTTAHEHVFLLAKAERYYYDALAIAEPGSMCSDARCSRADLRQKDGWDDAYFGNPPTGLARRTDKQRGHSRRHAGFNDRWDLMEKAEQCSGSRNARTVWEIATQPFPEAHFATFPEELARRCIAAGTSERGCCRRCGAPWERLVDVTYDNPGNRSTNGPRSTERKHQDFGSAGYEQRLERRTETTAWRPTCSCPPADPVPALVLDPFAGSGTVGEVAFRMGRRFVGLDLKLDYCRMALRRIPPLALAAGTIHVP